MLGGSGDQDYKTPERVVAAIGAVTLVLFLIAVLTR